MASWKKVEKLAHERFGIESFRPGQRALIRAVLEGESAIGILPTGAGKSLCYQLPALLLPGTTVVVSPLIALMQDQKEKLTEHGVPTASLNSAQTQKENRESLEEIEEGEARLVYVTPERLENSEFLQTLKANPISLVVIDEAHCISQWGHDFRPAYLTVRDAIKKLGNPPVLALTATATSRIVEDIAQQLGLKDPRIVDQGIERPNLRFEVVPTVNEEIKNERLVELLKGTEGTGIIYTATVRAADKLRGYLLTKGIVTGRYHGKLTTREREQNQQAFMEDGYKAMVATKAFGLGIDKPNVRFVIHYHFPDSLESYYQEAGRAGRDGDAATATLLYRLEDKRIQSYFLGGKYPSLHESEKVYRTLVEFFKESSDRKLTATQLAELSDTKPRRLKVILSLFEQTGIVSRGRYIKLKRVLDQDALVECLDEFASLHQGDRERLDKMMRYAQSARCRLQTLRDYFGYESGEECERCDNCKTLQRRPAVEKIPSRSSSLQNEAGAA